MCNRPNRFQVCDEQNELFLKQYGDYSTQGLQQLLIKNSILYSSPSC